jgi:hypothetical protein
MKIPENSSGEMNVRRTERKLKRQGTPKGRKGGMSHNVAGMGSWELKPKDL